MTQTEMFEWLGSPLANNRWSWGSIRSDGVIFLRVWQDEIRAHNNKSVVRVTKHAKFADRPSNLGYKERLHHLDLVKNGAKCYMIMCEAKDPFAPKRVIKSFNTAELFLASAAVDIDGDTWLELAERVSANNIRLTR